MWSERYDISLVNANGNGNIPARYQDRYQNGSYELVLIFCDTDKKPYEQFEDIKRKINEFHAIDSAASRVIIFGNPCTMQIIIKHWTDENLKSSAKKVNSELIEKFTQVKLYKGKHEQIIEVMKYITNENYEDMRFRIEKLSRKDCDVGSTNFIDFIKLFESNNDSWIKNINDELES